MGSATLNQRFIFVALYIMRGPYFVSAECGDPPIIEHAIIEGTIGEPPYREGTEVEYRCVPGYQVEGFTVFRCSSGLWIDGTLKCMPTYCQPLRAPKNGYMSNKPLNIPASSTTFACNQGYDIVGSQTLECLTDGSWRPSNPPTCEIRRCPNIPRLDNGQLILLNPKTEENVYGSVLRVSCNSGYVASGNTKIRCQEDGTWEAVPACFKSVCGGYPGLANAQLCIKGTFFNSNTFFMTCEAHASLQGSATGSADCNTNTGEWDNAAITCKCGCHIHGGPGVVLNNVHEGNYLSSGHDLDWECSSGEKSKSTAEPLKCVEGHITQPECIGGIWERPCVDVKIVRVDEDNYGNYLCENFASEQENKNTGISRTNIVVVVLFVHALIIFICIFVAARYRNKRKRRSLRETELASKILDPVANKNTNQDSFDEEKEENVKKTNLLPSKDFEAAVI